MKFTLVAVLLSIAANAALPGKVISIDCDTCKCTGEESVGIAGADGGRADEASCKDACETFDSEDNDKLIWNFYELLVKIGSSCTVEAEAYLPTEVDDWCEAEAEGTETVAEQRGWVIKKPTQNNSVPKYTEITNRGVGLFRIWQADADGWHCPSDGLVINGTAINKSYMVNPDRPSCPISIADIPWKTMTREGGTVEYLEFIDNEFWATNTVDDYYTIRASDYGEGTSCFGEVTKIEWQVRVVAAFQGLDTLPITTPPTGFEKGGAAANASVPASLLLALATYLAL